MLRRLLTLTFAATASLWAGVTITTPGLPSGTLGDIYPATDLAGGGGTGALTWAATGLPAGLALSGAGSLTGIPTVSGNFQVTVTVKDSAAPPTQDTRAFALNIEGLVFTSAYCPNADGSYKRECQLGETMVVRFKNLNLWC